MAKACTTRKLRGKANQQDYSCYNDRPVKPSAEQKKEVFRRAMIFTGACLLVCGLLPSPGQARGPLALSQMGFSACRPGPARFTARAQDFTLAQSKTARRQANIALATPVSWAGLIQIKGHLAHASQARAAYSLLQSSHTSDRAPPPLATS